MSRSFLPGNGTKRGWRLPWRRESRLVQCEATGSDNVFVIQAPKPWPGWNMLELDVEGQIEHGLATVVLESTSGQGTVGVPLRVGKTSKRLIYVPSGTRRITLRTVNTRGRLQLCQLRWVWLTPRFAHDRLVRRLGSVHPNYKGMSPSAVKSALRDDAIEQGYSWRRMALRAYTATFARACAHHDYHQWVKVVENRPQRRVNPEDAKPLNWPFQHRPLFSVLMPLNSAGLGAGMAGLEASLASLRDQQYSHWELCLVVSPVLSNEVRQTLAQLCADHPRIHLLEGRSDCLETLSHQAFLLASGEGVLWLSLGDTLAPATLHRMARAWNRHPAAQLFYADEDELHGEGRRARPSFKPEWNPDLLLSKPYIGRPALYRRSLVEQLQGGSWINEYLVDTHNPALLDYALVLRFWVWQSQRPASEPPAAQRIPRMLYHRHETNAVMAPGDSQHATQLVQQALKMLPTAETAHAKQGIIPGSTRVCWPVPVPAPLVSVLIPTRDGVEVLKPCIEMILSTTEYPNFEILILDNRTFCPKTLAYLEEVQRRDGRVRVLRWPAEFNYSAINNFGVEAARGSLIALVNNDIEPLDGHWLSEMVSQACRPDIGCVGAKLYYPQGTVQHAGVIMGIGGVAGHAHRFFPGEADGYCGRLKVAQNLSAVTAACLMVRRSVYEEVGGLNEADLAVAFNDVDFCLKVRRAGYRNLWTPYAELTHHESATRHAVGSAPRVEKEAREVAYMRRNWGKLLAKDPAYNPNLTLFYEDFSLR